MSAAGRGLLVALSLAAGILGARFWWPTAKPECCLVTGLVYPIPEDGRAQFRRFLEAVPTGSGVLDLSTVNADADQIVARADASPVFVGGGHGDSRHWSVLQGTLWLGLVGGDGYDDSMRSLPLGAKRTRAAFVCACRLLGSEPARPIPDGSGYLDYHFDPAIVESIDRSFEPGLAAFCGFSTYVTCDEAAAARPFDASAWPGADVLEAFMSAGMARTSAPTVPVCLTRANAVPKRFEEIADMSAAAGEQWTIRYVDWQTFSRLPLPGPWLPRPPFAQPHPTAPTTDLEKTTASVSAYVEAARAWLATRGAGDEWSGDPAVADIRVRSLGRETSEGAIVLFRPRRGQRRILDLAPMLVWLMPNRAVKFGGGGQALEVEISGVLRVDEQRGLVIDGPEAIPPCGGATAVIEPGVLRGRPLEDLAAVDCLESDSRGAYVNRRIFRVRENVVGTIGVRQPAHPATP